MRVVANSMAPPPRPECLPRLPEWRSEHSATSSPDGIRRWTGSAATVPASTTTLTLCYYIRSGADRTVMKLARGRAGG